MKFELLFLDSYLKTDKLSFFLILISFYFLIKLKKYKFLSIIPLLFTINLEKNVDIQNPNVNIYMPQIRREI